MLNVLAMRAFFEASGERYIVVFLCAINFLTCLHQYLGVAVFSQKANLQR